MKDPRFASLLVQMVGIVLVVGMIMLVTVGVLAAASDQSDDRATPFPAPTLHPSCCRSR